MDIDSTLTRRMTTEQAVSAKPRFVSAVLPWLIGAGALVLYAITLNHWVSFGPDRTGPYSLVRVARVSGWTWQPELYEPLYWLVTLPVSWLPVKAIPLALNLFSLLCAVLTLVLLARSVALLPHDRTQDQREREHAPNALLSVPLAWLPPIFAAVVCGLQLTFWEHATVASGEILNLLLFAYVIRCLLEFRLDQRDSWLIRASFVYGLGMTNNWAMIGFFPLFLAALIWSKRLSFFNLNFLGRMFIFGMAGVLLYLLLPIVQSRSHIATIPFWLGLKANLGHELGMLVAWYKGGRHQFALLALTSLVPVLLISIRWASYFGDTSRLGVGLTTFIFHLSHALFLVVCVWVALDPPFSPRHFVNGQAFLTFYYLGALCVGYFSGYFLLVFRVQSDTRRRRNSGARLLHALATGAVAVLFVVAPLALLYRNLPQIRLTNGPMYLEMANRFLQPLPPKGAMVLSDPDPAFPSLAPRRLLLAQAAAARTGQTKAFMFVDSASLEYPDYHRFLRKKFGTRWPMEIPKGFNGRIPAPYVLQILVRVAAAEPCYYLQPSFGSYFESFYLEPHGLLYRLNLFNRTEYLPPTLPNDLLVENESFWNSADQPALQPLATATALATKPAGGGFLDKLAAKAHLAPESNWGGSMVAAFYSRALDFWAVELQKLGQLPQAATRFQQALDLNPDNIVAQVNLECNQNLRAGRKAAVPIAGTATDTFGKFRSWGTVMSENGPFDEPMRCFEQAHVFVGNKFYHQAAQQFYRVKTLDPDNLGAWHWLAQLNIMFQRPDDALDLVQQIRAREKTLPSGGTNENELHFITASAYLEKKDPAAADATLNEVISTSPTDTNLLATVTQVYMNFGFFSNAIATLDRQLAVTPDNVGALVNKGFASLQIKAFQQAVPPLSRALELQPTNSFALLNRAIAYLGSHELDAAQRDYESLQKIAPTFAPIYYGLGEIAYQKKDTNAAIRNYELYLTNNPPNAEEVKLVSKRLAELKPSR